MAEWWQNQRSAEGPCDGCPGCDAPYPLGGLGDPTSDVMLVGQQPAYNVDSDDVTDDMLWHRAKEQLEDDRSDPPNPLWKHMMNVGLAINEPPEALYFTNVVKCTGDDWSERLEHCRRYFPREVAAVQPQVILLHGGKVLSVVLDMFDVDYDGSVSSVHGTIVETSGLKLVCLYHWGYAYRRGNVHEYNETVRETVSEAYDT